MDRSLILLYFYVKFLRDAAGGARVRNAVGSSGLP